MTPFSHDDDDDQSQSPYHRFAPHLPRGEEHPIDVQVKQRRPLRPLAKQLRKAIHHLERALHSKQRQPWLNVEALWQEYRGQREQMYFDVGYEHGVLAGHAQAIRLLSGWSPKDVQPIADEIRRFARQMDLTMPRTLAALLEVAWSFALALEDVPQAPDPKPDSDTPARHRPDPSEGSQS